MWVCNRMRTHYVTASRRQVHMYILSAFVHTHSLTHTHTHTTQQVFREEIFEPGSSERTVKRFSAKLPPSSPFSDTNVRARRLSTGSALTNVSETESKQAARALGAAMLGECFSLV